MCTADRAVQLGNSPSTPCGAEVGPVEVLLGDHALHQHRPHHPTPSHKADLPGSAPGASGEVESHVWRHTSHMLMEGGGSMHQLSRHLLCYQTPGPASCQELSTNPHRIARPIMPNQLDSATESIGIWPTPAASCRKRGKSHHWLSPSNSSPPPCVQQKGRFSSLPTQRPLARRATGSYVDGAGCLNICASVSTPRGETLP